MIFGSASQKSVTSKAVGLDLAGLNAFFRVSIWKVSRLLSVSVSKATGLESLNVAKKRHSNISIIRRSLFVVFGGKKKQNMSTKLQKCRKNSTKK